MDKKYISRKVGRIKKKAAKTGGFLFELFDLILEVTDMLKNAK